MANRLKSLISLLLVACSVASARRIIGQEGEHNDLPEPIPVFVVGIQQNQGTGEIDNLGSFVSSLIYLRLLEVPSLTVHQVAKSPACGVSAQSGADTSQNRVVQNLASVPTQAGDFYVVEGTLEIRLPDAVLGYSVDKCEGRTLKRVFEDTQAFSLDHALGELTIAAHAIAFKLERVTPPTHVSIDAFQLEGDIPNVNLQDALRDEITQVISQSPDFAVTDSGDFKIAGKITVQKTPIFRVFAKGAIAADLHIDVRGKLYPLKSVSGTRDALPNFYSQVAQEVARALPGVVMAEHLQLPHVLENMQTEALLSKGRQLLDQCPKQGRRCGSAQDAIAVLSAAAQQGTPSWRVSWLLGRAQMLTGKDNDALISLETARKGMKEELELGKPIAAQEQTQVLNALGDVDKNTGRYDQSEAAYDESLAIIPAQLELYGKKSQVLEFDEKRPEALATLIQGLQVAGSDPIAQSFHDSARDIIRALQTDQYSKVEVLLSDAYRAQAPVAEEYALFMSRKWGELLDTNLTKDQREETVKALEKALELKPSDPDIQAGIYAHLARAQLNFDRQKTDFFLTKAESLPNDKVSPDNREWIERIRSQDCMNHMEYEKAQSYAELARRIKATDDATLMVATAALLRAEAAEKSAGAKLSPEKQREIKSLYQESADLAEPLVAKRFQNADLVLTEAGHSLGRDGKTREQFDRLVKHDPKDASAFNALMMVCSQYLFDFKCAFQAAQSYANLASGPMAATDYLDVAEIAILADRDEMATQWLEASIRQPDVSVRDKSLVYFYRSWLAIRHGRSDESHRAFEAWQGAIQQFRRSDSQLNWLFDGVKRALESERIPEKQRQCLLDMMGALEDNRQPLPSWPGSAASTTPDAVSSFVLK